MGYLVLLEISGVFDIGEVDSCVVCIMDLKVLDLGEVDKNCWENILLFNVYDEVKFVFVFEVDYVWVVDVFKCEYLSECCVVFFFLV